MSTILRQHPRAITAAAVAAVVAAFCLSSSLNSRLFGHFPQYRPLLRPAPTSGPGPLFDTSVDMAAIARARPVIRTCDKYLIYAPPTTPTLVTDDLHAVGYLTFLPALPVLSAADADCVLSYGSPAGPPGTPVTKRYSFGGQIYVLKTAAP